MRRSVAVRREEILDATAALLERHGLSEVRVADVAQALGMSAGLVYYHFGDKDTLVAAAFAHVFARDLTDVDHAVYGPDPMVKLSRIVHLFDGPDAPVGWQLWIDACSVAHREPAIHQVLTEINSAYAEHLRTVLEEGVAAGVFTCPDPAGAVERIFALNDGLSTAVTVLRTVTRAQLRAWMAAQIAAEAGVDVTALTCASVSAEPPSRPHAAQPTE